MSTETTTQAPRKPSSGANKLILALLNSPIHGLFSKFLMPLTFTGHKSGRRYTIPVGYAQEGNTLTLFTDHQWWKNLRASAPVTVRLRGKNRTGTAEVFPDDKELTYTELDKYIRRAPQAARAFNVTLNEKKEPTPDSLREAIKRFTLIRIHLAD